MRDILKYELKKLIRRPFNIVVSLVCVAVLIFCAVMMLNDNHVFVWGLDIYGSYENIPKKELKLAKDYGYTDGTLVFKGKKVIEFEKENSNYVSGVIDEERYMQLVTEYINDKDNPDAYVMDDGSTVLDVSAMDYRAYVLMNQGMTRDDVLAYDKENPLYEMTHEYQYGYMKKWQSIRYLFDEAAINVDGTIKPFEQAFPHIKDSGFFEQSETANIAAGFQINLVAVFTFLILLVSLSSVFSEEVSCNTEAMLLCAKHGRDKLIQSKILAGIIYTFICLTVLTITNIVSEIMCYGFDGFNTSVQFNLEFYYVPFTVNFRELLLLVFAFQTLGLIAMAGLIMLMSCLFRSALPTMITGVLFINIVVILSMNVTGFWRDLMFSLPPSLTFIYSFMQFAKNETFTHLPQWIFSIIMCSVLLIVSIVVILRKYKYPRKV